MLPRYFYHLTLKKNLPAIVKQGLVPGAPQLFSSTLSLDNQLHIYKRRPVFISIKPWMEQRNLDLVIEYGKPNDFACFQVDTTGLNLLPDILCLVDKGAYLEEDHLWFEEEEHPLLEWENRRAKYAGNIYYSTLLSKPSLMEAAIKWAGSAAVTSKIEPARLKVLSKW